MRYEARITAFDVMDTIHVAIVVRQSDSLSQVTPETVMLFTTDLQGEGVDSAQCWLRDVLVGALEYL